MTSHDELVGDNGEDEEEVLEVQAFKLPRNKKHSLPVPKIKPSSGRISSLLK
jgi:hypothetical protein